MIDTFWNQVDAAIEDLTTALDADDVVAILNAYGPPSSGDALFAGSGGDATVWDALDQAGWHIVWMEASYHWCSQAPDGSMISYVEGDVYLGDQQS